MKYRTKRNPISWLLALAMLFSLTSGWQVTLMAAEGQAESYQLYIGGVEVTPENLSGTGWSYNPDTSTLTLNGYSNVAEDSYGYYILQEENNEENTHAALYYAGDKDLTLVLEGDNCLALPERKEDKPAYSMGLYIPGEKKKGPALTIIGSGTLTVTGGSAAERSCGIYCYKNLTVSSGTLSATGGEAGKNSYGIYCYEEFNLTDGSVKALGSHAEENSCGFYSYDGFSSGDDDHVIYGVAISGGELTACGGSAGLKSYGMQALYSVVAVMGGTVTVAGGEAGETSCGLELGIFTLNAYGGKVTAIGKTATGEEGKSYGIYGIAGSVNLNNDAEILCEGGNVKNGVSCGVECISLSADGKMLTAVGGEAAYSYGMNIRMSGFVDGGTVNVKGGTAEKRSCGLYADTEIWVTGGLLHAEGGQAAEESAGIYLDSHEYEDAVLGGGTISITGGEINAAGGEANGTDSRSYGIYASPRFADNRIAVKAGKVTATGGSVRGEGNLCSEGVYAQNIIVTKGLLSGVGGKYGGKSAGENETVIETKDAGENETPTETKDAKESEVVAKEAAAEAKPTSDFAKQASFASYGIHALSTLTISGGQVTGTAETSSEKEPFVSQGVTADAIEIAGGSLTGSGKAVGVSSQILKAEQGEVIGTSETLGICAASMELGEDVIVIGTATGEGKKGISLQSKEEEDARSSDFAESLNVYMGASKEEAEKSTVEDWMAASGKEDSYLPYVRIAPKPFSVSFDANGGAFGDGSICLNRNAQEGDALAMVAPAFRPTKENEAFAGWALDPEGKEPVKEAQVSGEMTVYAIWEKPDFIITLDGNGGLFDDGEETREIGVLKGTTVRQFIADAPRPADYTEFIFDCFFAYWSDKEDGEEISKEGLITENKTIYAIWEEIFPDIETFIDPE